MTKICIALCIFFALQGVCSNEADDAFERAEKNLRLSNFEEAILWYRARLTFPDGDWERWRSKYMLGVCFEQTGNWDSALRWYLDAFQENPSCADPLKDLAKHYRMEGKNDLSLLFALHGNKVCPDSPLFDEELAIASYYTAFKREGLLAADRIVLSKNTTSTLKEQAYRNMVFYITPLEGARFKKIEFALPPVIEGGEERYHPTNPSLIKWGNGYKVICRAVNYTQENAAHYHTEDPSGVFATRNFLLTYDEEFQLLDQSEIVEELSRKRYRTHFLKGLEDCRLFSFNDALWFSCTTPDTNAIALQISLGRLSSTEEGGITYVEALIPLEGPDPMRCEKNWLPCVVWGELMMLYSCDPLTFNKPDLATGSWNVLLQQSAPLDFRSFRGSAAPIAFEEGYLMLVHEVAFFEGRNRVYLHRLLQMDRDFHVTHLSHPFFFQHKGVEFCLSMALDEKREEVIFSVGIEDREAFFCFLKTESVKELLEPLN